ncbi:MAG: 50S ribosomal protein L6 [Clostridiales bacterium]|nr:50S ribosomal protein L6 [Clostridiales bacterium]
MSRIGRKPITVPAGVDITIGADNLVTVKGPKGTLTQQFHQNMLISKEGDTLTVVRPDDEKQNRALHGLTRSLLNNMVVGVTEGYSKTLEIVGVGYRAAKEGKSLKLGLGYSHGITIDEEGGITYEVPNQNTIIVHGIDKEAVGQAAAIIRSKRPPEPYLGKGVKYADERIRRKAGKAGK